MKETFLLAKSKSFIVATSLAAFLISRLTKNIILNKLRMFGLLNNHSMNIHTSIFVLLLLHLNPLSAQILPNYINTDSYSSSVSSVTVDLPSGSDNGNLILIHIVTDDEGTMTKPIEFTELYNYTSDGNGPHTGLFYRIIDGTESASYNFTFPSEPAVVTTLRYTNVDTSNPFDVMASAAGDSNAPQAPSVTTTKNGRTILQFIGIDGASAGVLSFSSSTATLLSTAQSGNTGGAEMMIVAEFQSIAGATPVGDFTFSTDEWTGITIALNTYSVSTNMTTGSSCPAGLSTYTVDYELPASNGTLEVLDPEGTILTTQAYSSSLGNATLNFTLTMSGEYTVRDQANPSISISDVFFIDTDGDTYCDDMDADDDNDGILDIVENPSCFNLETGYENGDRAAIITASSDYTYNDGDPQQLIDGIISSTGNGIRRTNGDFDFASAPGSLWQLQLSQGIKYTSFTIFTEGNVFLDTDIYGTMQGSNNGSSWTDLTTQDALLMDDPSTIYSIELTQNLGSYTYYRMYCTSGRVDDDEWLGEIEGTTEVVGSAPFTLEGCTSSGSVLNFLNNDSDGDGCVDALEGSKSVSIANVDANGRITGTIDANGVPALVNGGQGIGDSNNGTYYNSDCPCTDPTNTANNCDFDGDSYKNEVDEDDDNDGILDVEECGDFKFLDSPGNATNNTVTVCYNVASNGINGSLMTFIDDKLLNVANFGMSGIYKVNFNMVEIAAADVMVDNLIAQGCQIFQVGGESGASGTEETALTEDQKQELYNWSVQSPSHIVLAFQGMVTAWTDHIGDNGTSNPTQATVPGRGIFKGPFGTISGFNQAGSYQGVFVVGSDPYCAIMQDNVQGVVGLVDEGSQDIFIADFGLFSETGGLTSSSNLTSSSDKMLGNLYAFMAQFILEEKSNMCLYLEECLNNTDGDSVVDVFDLDSDNDGCPDALEGDGGFNDSQIENDTLVGGIGMTGIPSVAGAIGQLIGQSQDDTMSDACSFDLKITVNQVSATASKGEFIDFIYTLTNESTNSVDDVQIRILTPSNTEFVAAIPSQGDYSNLTKIWNVGTAGVGDQTIKVTVKVK